MSDQTPDRRQPRREAELQDGTYLVLEPETAPAPGSDLRLVIEPGGEGGDYVYKLIDRATGKVVAERSSDQVAHLAEEPDYKAGTVINTKA